MIIYKKPDKSHLKIEGAVYRKAPRKNFLRTIFKRQNPIHKIPVLSRLRDKKYRHPEGWQPKQNEIKEIKYNGPIVSKDTARAKGLNKYFTGKPCINGHVDQRWKTGGACVSCLNERVKKRFARKRREAGIIPLAERVTPRKLALEKGEYKYWSESPCVHGHIGWRATKTCVCLECKKLSKRVPEDKRKKFFRTPEERKRLRREHEKMKGSRRRAKKNGAHTMTQIRAMFVEQDAKCNNSNCRACIKDYHERDHIMPIALGGSDNIDNIQLLCRSCNCRKGALHPDEWEKIR